MMVTPKMLDHLQARSDRLSQQLPWYRNRWPWLLMLGPAIVAVGCMFTIWLAHDHRDDSVALDYYKRGLVIDQDIRRQQRAAALHISAQLQINDRGLITIQLQGDELPHKLVLKLTHPTQSSRDRSITLYRQSETGIYQAKTWWSEAASKEVVWYVTLDAKEWRLDSKWRMDAGSISIQPHS